MVASRGAGPTHLAALFHHGKFKLHRGYRSLYKTMTAAPGPPRCRRPKWLDVDMAKRGTTGCYCTGRQPPWLTAQIDPGRGYHSWIFEGGSLPATSSAQSAAPWPAINAATQPVLRPKRSVWIAFGMVLLVGACSDEPGFDAPAPVPPPRPRYVHAGALAGMRQRVGFFTGANPDCTTTQLPGVKVTLMPLHGQISTAQGEVEEVYLIGTKRYDCNGHKEPATELFYTSAPDFAGTDAFAIIVNFPGRNIPYRYTISVFK